MQVEVILASKPDQSTYMTAKGPTIYTLRLRYPRFIHSEIMTHRVFSRNARSSRAVPVAKMIEEIRTNPAVPWHWGKNQKGMQASEDCNELLNLSPDLPIRREEAWLFARDRSLATAEAFMKSGYHKQIPNRLLEPFMWIDTLVTATDWDNFLWLRDHKDTEPHFQDLARLIRQSLDEAKPQTLGIDEWHLPYIEKSDRVEAIKRCSNHAAATEFLLAISAARCARISYAPFDGDASYEKELQRFSLLINSDRMHASPIEHQAKVDLFINGEWLSPKLHRNFTGWIQARGFIEHRMSTGGLFHEQQQP